MPGHPVPQRTDITGQRTPAAVPRAARALTLVTAALLALALATASTPVRAASLLSDGSVTPTSGTTATAFTFSVHYTSTDSPTRPAQAVWAQVDDVTVTLIKVSGSAHDGTWQGTATLPVGTWQVTFHATTSGDPQPQPLPGPVVTVAEPPPTAAPAPPPPAPLPTNPPPPPLPIPQPTAPPTIDDDPTRTQPPSSSPTPAASGSARSRTPVPTPTRAADEDDDPTGTPGPSDPAADDAAAPPGSMLASLLIVGGIMSLAGAAVLARQWHVSRKAGSR
jgi:hypothetical protein